METIQVADTTPSVGPKVKEIEFSNTIGVLEVNVKTASERRGGGRREGGRQLKSLITSCAR